LLRLWGRGFEGERVMVGSLCVVHPTDPGRGESGNRFQE
jgi:hypothetical protein